MSASVDSSTLRTSACKEEMCPEAELTHKDGDCDSTLSEGAATGVITRAGEGVGLSGASASCSATPAVVGDGGWSDFKSAGREAATTTTEDKAGCGLCCLLQVGDAE